MQIKGRSGKGEKIINGLHHKLDIFSISLLLYCSSVLLLLWVLNFISNDLIRVALSLGISVLPCRRKVITVANQALHTFFGINR